MKGFSAALLSIALLGAIFVAPARSRSLPQTSFDNIKVMTEMSDTEIRKEMQVWTEALGVQCNYCHTAGDFAAETNPKKDVARKMFTMVKTVNKDFLDGKANCALCHRGAAVPTL